ncbi:helix-turn-helix protein [Roseimicrobium gellanilyticum]|uniref:Helix-turn-helix protein n=1 Tax=Roseimicrobium gellanilyticum TaxID=748857 RepID=A0A366HV67_9BACT|nr:helix-turn-helix domain-containing protein [Roseimicrobium gellanilyticum]RBP48166.1 helix-turn-helix protein [Roseimicrobium gellanilyticum]
MVYSHQIKADDSTMAMKTMKHGVQETRDLLDTTQAMSRLGMSENQLARLRTSRRISYFKRGGRILYAPEEVERVLRESEVPALRPVVEVRGSEKG